MKNLLSLLALCTAISCANKGNCQEFSIIEDSKKALNYYIAHYASNPTDFKVIGMDTLVANDSLCILGVQYVTENKTGGHVNAKGQYVYLTTHDGEKYSYFLDGIEERYDAMKMRVENVSGLENTKALVAPLTTIESPEDFGDIAIMIGAEDLWGKYVDKHKNLSHYDSLYYCSRILTDIHVEMGDAPQVNNVDLRGTAPVKVYDITTK